MSEKTYDNKNVKHKKRGHNKVWGFRERGKSESQQVGLIGIHNKNKSKKEVTCHLRQISLELLLHFLLVVLVLPSLAYTTVLHSIVLYTR